MTGALESGTKVDMSRITYLTKMIQQKFRHTLFAKSSEFIRVVERQSKIASPEKIGFYLDNPFFIHLGDQLFFEPALRLITGKFDAYIKPTPDMAEYFIKSGAKVITNEKIFDCDMIVTREELLPEVLSKTKADIISINTFSEDMRYRISDAIAYSLVQLLKIEIPGDFDFSPWRPSATRQQIADDDDKVILAPYVNSGWFRAWNSDVRQLSLLAKTYAEESGLSLFLVGGKEDADSKIPAVIGALFRGLARPIHSLSVRANYGFRANCQSVYI